MAKRRSRSDSDEEHYQSDNSVSDVASKPVKSNTKQKSKRQEKQTTPATNSIKKPKLDPESDNQGVTLRRNDEGNSYIELGKKRRVTVREFKGQTLIDIREFYGDDGEERPGKKGISLTVEQWHTLKGCLEQIDSLVADLKPRK